MAQIPTYGPASVQAPVRTGAADNRGALQAAQAAGDLANTGQQLGDWLTREANNQRTQETAEEIALARAKADNARFDDEAEIAGITTDLQTRVADGSLPWEKAPEEYRLKVGALKPPTIEALTPSDQERFRGALDRNRSTGDAALGRIVQTGKRLDMKAQVVGLRDNLGKLASDPSADLDKIIESSSKLRELYAAGGFADTFDKDQQDFSDRVYSDNARARLVLGRDSIDELTALEQDITAEDGRYAGKLDSDKRNVLVSQLLARKDQLERKAKDVADHAEADAERALTKFEAQAATGVMAPIDTMTQWQSTVRTGTPEQHERFQELVRSEAELREVRKLPPADQRSYVQKLQVQQQAQGATVAQIANLRRTESIIEADLKRLKDSPLEQDAILNGTVVQPLNLEALFSGDVAAVQDQIAQRMVTLTKIRKQYGAEAGNAPLLPQEASALAGVVAISSAKRVTEVFGMLNRIIADPDAYAAAVQQIAPDSPVRAMAGSIFALQRRGAAPDGAITASSPQGKFGDVAQYMLKGEALLNPTKNEKGQDGKGTAFPMPTPERVSAAISQKLGTSFAGRPDEFNTAVQGVRAYYAARAADEGDVSGVLKSDRLTLAVDAVVGRKTKFEGRDVIPPWGMPEGEFRDRADLYVQARLKTAGIADPGDVSLMNVRGFSDVYLLIRGIEPVVDGNGAPLIVNMRPRR